MDIVSITASEYTPEWNGNKDDPKPIVCELVPLNSEQRLECLQVTILEDGTSQAIPNYVRLFRYGCKSIRNLKVDGKELVTPREVLMSAGAGLEMLVRDIGGEVFLRNREIDTKNSQ